MLIDDRKQFAFSLHLVWKQEAGLSLENTDLVAEELRETSHKGPKACPLLQQSSCTGVGPDMVIPFQYSKAKQEKKRAREQCSQGRGTQPSFGKQDDGFKKAKKRRLHPKSGNRSVKFTKKV